MRTVLILSVPQLHEFLGQVMGTLQLTCIPGNAIQSLWISRDRKVAEAEFRSVEEACSALQLKTVPHKGTNIRFTRPSIYNDEEIEAAAAAEGIVDLSALMAKASAAMITTQTTTTATTPGETANTVTTASAPIKVTEPPAVVPTLQSNVIMIADLHKALNESQVRELCSPFGNPKRFNLIKNATEVSKNTAVCEYESRKSALAALTGLDGLSLGYTTRLMAQNVPQAMADTLLQKAEAVDPESKCIGIVTVRLNLILHLYSHALYFLVSSYHLYLLPARDLRMW